MTYYVSQLQSQFKKLGYIWPKFHLIGVRSKVDKLNSFDDKFYLFVGSRVYVYTGTTNPGGYWLKNFLVKEGVAVLKPGQYIDCWTLGLHRGLYKAWKQIKPVIVCRDKDKDDKSECSGVEQNGLFGINIHRSSENWISNIIDKWSAGCQVLNVPDQYKQFIELSEASKLKALTYTLLDEF